MHTFILLTLLLPAFADSGDTADTGGATNDTAELICNEIDVTFTYEEQLPGAEVAFDGLDTTCATMRDYGSVYWSSVPQPARDVEITYSTTCQADIQVWQEGLALRIVATDILYPQNTVEYTDIMRVDTSVDILYWGLTISSDCSVSLCEVRMFDCDVPDSDDVPSDTGNSDTATPDDTGDTGTPDTGDWNVTVGCGCMETTIGKSLLLLLPFVSLIRRRRSR